MLIETKLSNRTSVKDEIFLLNRALKHTNFLVVDNICLQQLDTTKKEKRYTDNKYFLVSLCNFRVLKGCNSIEEIRKYSINAIKQFEELEEAL